MSIHVFNSGDTIRKIAQNRASLYIKVPDLVEEHDGTDDGKAYIHRDV